LVLNLAQCGKAFNSLGISVKFNPNMHYDHKQILYIVDLAGYPAVKNIFCSKNSNNCILLFKDGSAAIFKPEYSDSEEFLLQKMGVVGKWGYK
jgi:hypothetical protein